MADFFNNNRGRGGRDDGLGRDDGFDMRENNNFDKRYTDSSRSGGFFDRPPRNRATRATDDRLERQLPPIEPYGATAQPYHQPMPNAAFVQGGMSQQVFPIGNVVIFSPKSYSDVQTLIDHLRKHEPAIVDFAGVGDESGQRILDFLSGAIYALGGSMQRISGTIFLLTPSGVSISAPTDITKSIEERRNKR